MRVLADRHHAGLLYSLQLLFEDRLGYDLYVPVGHDWWDEGYWRFGEVFGDDRLARQYLRIDAKYTHEGDGWLFTYDTEYPHRRIRCVTLEQFRELEWDFVIASVQENQHGLHRAAKEAGARSVYQIGNRGQRVDWSLDPLALVSAEAPIEGRGVMYHQEFEKDSVFAYRSPFETSDPVIASFVNCMDRTSQWSILQETRALLADAFSFRVHGSDGEHGKVVPTTSLALEMARAAFGWHDKPQGDGFGHVIHYWSAVGRPLVGHASFYEGLMPGALWEDGVTSVNLDGRTPEEVADVLREVAADPDRHATMCRAIRERLDELVDFDAEEQRIRGLLGL